VATAALFGNIYINWKSACSYRAAPCSVARSAAQNPWVGDSFTSSSVMGIAVPEKSGD